MKPAPTFQSTATGVSTAAEVLPRLGGMRAGAAVLVLLLQPRCRPVRRGFPPSPSAGSCWRPLLSVGAKIARWLRRRNWVEVHHVNAVEDTTEKYYVPPELWRAREIDGPAVPRHGGVVGSPRYEYLEVIGQLRRGLGSKVAKNPAMTSSNRCASTAGSSTAPKNSLRSVADRVRQRRAQPKLVTLTPKPRARPDDSENSCQGNRRRPRRRRDDRGRGHPRPQPTRPTYCDAARGLWAGDRPTSNRGPSTKRC